MVNLEKCSYPACSEDRIKLFDGNPFCKTHYENAILKEFNDLYQQWINDTQLNNRLKYLMGRVVDELFEYQGSYLSAARIRDRGYNFCKIDNSTFTFQIERHPNAFKDGYVSRIIIQKWLVNIQSRIAILEEELDNP